MKKTNTEEANDTVEELTDNDHEELSEIESLELTQEIEKLELTQELEKLNQTSEIEILDETQKIDVGQIVKSNKKKTSKTGTIIKILLIILINIFCIAVCVVFGIKAKNEYDKNKVEYKSKGTISYQVCKKDEKTNIEECQEEDLEYTSSDVDIIKVKNEYINEFKKNIEYKYSYNIKAKLMIYNDSENENIHTKEYVLLKNQKIPPMGQSISINTETEIDYKKYRKYVEDYLKKNNLNANGKLEVFMNINDGTREKKITTIKIPVTGLSFKIEKEDTSENGTVGTDLIKDIKSAYMTYTVTSLISLLISIIITIFSIMSFNKTTHNKD